MNSGQMTGAAAGGLLVAAAGPGWALTLCGIGMSGTVPLMLAIKGTRAAALAGAGPGMIAALRDGWTEFRSHTWLWVIVIQFCLVMMAWCAAFQVLGPVVAKAHLGGPAAWGAITAADSFGLIAGGLVSLRFTPRKPMLFVVLTGGAIAISPLSLALVLPLPVICLAAFCLGVLVEMMLVQWTVAMTRAIAPDKLARVSSYDALGSMMAMPVGALIAGPVAAAIGVPGAQLAAAALIAGVSGLCLIPRDIRTIRGDQLGAAMRGDAEAAAGAGAALPEPALAVPS